MQKRFSHGQLPRAATNWVVSNASLSNATVAIAISSILFIGPLMVLVSTPSANASEGDGLSLAANQGSSSNNQESTANVSNSHELNLEKAELIAALIKDLSHDDFSTRELASKRLIHLGLVAVAPLESIQNHPDREVRYRTRRILAILNNLEFRHRLSAFMSDQTSMNGYGLPGWDAYSKTVGQDSKARALFVKMQRSETKTLKVLETRDPLRITTVILSRIQEIQNSLNRSSVPVEFETIVSLLFLCEERDQLLDDQSHGGEDSTFARSILGLCYLESFRDALKGGPYRSIARNLVGRWILKADDSFAVEAMYFSIENDIPQGLTVARKIASNRSARKDLVQFAVQTIAKMGDRSDVRSLEKILEDSTPLFNEKNRTTQMRDIALAAMIHLFGQKFDDFGLSEIRMNETLVFGINTVGFSSEKERTANLEKWREFLAKQEAAQQTTSSSKAG